MRSCLRGCGEHCALLREIVASRLVAQGRAFTIDVALSEMVAIVKEKIAAVEGVPTEQFRLVWASKLLDEERTLTSSGILTESMLHMLRGGPRGKKDLLS